MYVHQISMNTSLTLSGFICAIFNACPLRDVSRVQRSVKKVKFYWRQHFLPLWTRSFSTGICSKMLVACYANTRALFSTLALLLSHNNPPKYIHKGKSFGQCGVLRKQHRNVAFHKKNIYMTGNGTRYLLFST